MKTALSAMLLIAAAVAAPALAEEVAADPVAQLDAFIAEQKEAGKIDTEAAMWKTRLPMPPKATFADNAEYFWIMSTNKGDIKIKLLPGVAPCCPQKNTW